MGVYLSVCSYICAALVYPEITQAVVLSEHRGERKNGDEG